MRSRAQIPDGEQRAHREISAVTVSNLRKGKVSLGMTQIDKEKAEAQARQREV